MAIVVTGVKGTRAVATRYPTADGLVVGTTSQVGHQMNLLAQRGSFVKRRFKIGLN